MDYNNRQFAEVKNLILSFTRTNFRTTMDTLEKILDPSLFLVTIRFVFDNISFENRSEKDECMIHLLRGMFQSSKSFPNFPTVLVGIFENVLRRKQKVLEFIIKELNLSLPDQLIVAVTLTQDDNFRSYGLRHIRQRVNEFAAIYHLVPPSYQQSFTFIVKSMDLKNNSPEINQEFHVSPMFDRFDERTIQGGIHPEDMTPLVPAVQPIAPIVQLVEDLGFACTANKKILRIILKDSPTPINERTVADLVKMMSNGASNKALANMEKFKSFFRQKNREKLTKDVKKVIGWNVGVFADTINDLFPNLNFDAIQPLFDDGVFQVRSPPSFNVIVEFFQRNNKSLGHFILRKVWKSGIHQATFIYFALMCSLPDFLDPSFRQVELGELATLSGMSERTPWMNLELITVLLKLTETDNDNDNFARNMFEFPMIHNKIPLLCGVAQSSVENGVSFDIMSELMGPFIQHKGQFNVVAHVSRLNSRMVMKSLFVMYSKDTRLCPRIVDVLQENRDMVGLLSYQPYHLSLTLCFVAARRSVIKLEEFLSGGIQRGMRFVHDALVYCRSMIQNPTNYGIPSPLTKEEYLTLLKMLAQCGAEGIDIIIGDLTAYIEHMGDERYENVRLPASVLSLHPAQQAPQHHTPPPPPPDGVGDFEINDQVEKWSTKFFETMFAGTRTVIQSLQKLREFKESTSAEGQQKYATLIHNMFDEFRFFDQYPMTQLRIMAEFFGRAMAEELLAGKTMKYAMVYVMKSLLDKGNSNYYTFGQIALNRVKHRLYEWRDFVRGMGVSSLLNSSPMFSRYLQTPLRELERRGGHGQEKEHSEYHSSDTSDTRSGSEELEEGEEEEGEEDDEDEEDDEPQTPGSPPTNIPTKGGFLNIKMVHHFQRGFKGKRPEEEHENRFRFLMNNLTDHNAMQKAEEFLHLPEDYYEFFAMSLVAGRVCLEQNNAPMYGRFVEYVGRTSKKFQKAVMKTTIDLVQFLYQSEKIGRDMSERQLFKTLGNWLGLITIAKNRPVFKRELDLKRLIVDSFRSGKLTAVVPFVTRLIIGCKFASVLKPPNPWIMSIIRLLSEVHAIEDLKLNIKFDIEMMGKTLGDMSVVGIENDGILTTSIPFVRNESNPDTRDVRPAPPTTTKFKQEFDFSKVHCPEPTLEGIRERVVISQDLEIFDTYPRLGSVVVLALEQSIKEICAPVVKRSINIATKTTMDLVTKDFCAERDIGRLKEGALAMVRNLSSNLSMVTCKHPLRVSMESKLKGYLTSMLVVPMSKEMKRKIEDVSKRVTEENIHVGCIYVEILATERAIQEISRSIENEVQQRRKHHETGARVPWTMYHRIFSDSVNTAPQLPEVLMNTSEMGAIQRDVYRDFTTQLIESKKMNQQTNEFSEKFAIADGLIKEVVKLVQTRPTNEAPQENERSYQEITHRLIQLIETTPNVFEFSVEVQRSILSRFYASTGQSILKDVFIFIMERIHRLEGNEDMKKMAFHYWSNLDEERKISYDTIVLLLGNILPLGSFDSEMSKIIKNSEADFVLNFGLRSYEIIAHPDQGGDLPKIFDALNMKSQFLSQDSRGRLALLSQPYYIQGGRPSPQQNPRQQPHIHEGGESRDPILQVRAQHGTQGGPTDLYVEASMEKRNMVMQKFVEYIQLYESTVTTRTYPGAPKLGLFVKKQLSDHHLLDTNGDWAEFVSLLITDTVKYFIQNQKENVTLSGYRYIDAFSSLISVALQGSKFEQMLSRLEMCLNIVAHRLREDHRQSLIQVQSGSGTPIMFHQKPYLRFFSNMLVEMNRVEDPDQEMIQKFSTCFHSLDPNKVPGFVFGWMDLISHRCFVPRLLLSKNAKTYEEFHNLMIRLFTFIHPFLLKGQLTTSVKQIYKGILRILLVLLHDFSEFLCVYHFSLVGAIPPNCIQIRNLILSAFPRHMKLPDPFTPNLKVDLLPEINVSPKILSDYTRALEDAELKEKIDQFLSNNGRNKQILEDIKDRFMYRMGEGKETKYDVALINSVVLYVGIQTLGLMNEKRTNVMNSPGVSIYVYLTRELDYEGRYHFFNAFMNQLRYPNSHSHFFSCVILFLYSSHLANPEPAKDPELIAEQITRVLLERLIVNRPHPWGLLITFIELVKNQTFDFWNKKFIHCAPSIERLFTNVGHSCLRSTPTPTPMMGGQVGNQGGTGNQQTPKKK